VLVAGATAVIPSKQNVAAAARRRGSSYCRGESYDGARMPGTSAFAA
jgi:hypothetical protein